MPCRSERGFGEAGADCHVKMCREPELHFETSLGSARRSARRTSPSESDGSCGLLWGPLASCLSRVKR